MGDDVNDMPMIRGAGLGVAMGNALPVVKAAAARMAPSQDEDGLVARWSSGCWRKEGIERAAGFDILAVASREQPGVG